MTLKEDTISDIHGDLTVENIVCYRGRDVIDYYIIDPNPNNLLNSQNLDYAKLLQSLHGGYEFLMRTNNFEVNENQINFLNNTSQQYSLIYNFYRNYLIENFSDNKVKSIYFHEIVHWLRLLPYKIKKDGEKAIVFYASFIVILNEVYEMYCLNVTKEEKIVEEYVSYI